MTIILNGEPRDLSVALPVAQFLEQAGYGGMLVAVAINGTFVARGAYADTIINNGDAVEIVAPMQGG
jgi:sulfur carrier protein